MSEENEMTVEEIEDLFAEASGIEDFARIKEKLAELDDNTEGAARSSALMEKCDDAIVEHVSKLKGEKRAKRKKTVVAGVAIVVAIIAIIALIAGLTREKIPEDAYKVTTTIGAKFTTADSLRNDLIADAAKHFCDPSHEWKVEKSSVDNVGGQKFHVKADLADTFEKVKEGSDGKVKLVVTYNRKIETDVLLSGSDATFYNFEVTKDDMSSKDVEIKTTSSSSGSSSSSSSGSSSSKSYSSSKTKCHLCGGLGKVKYYSGGAGSDYTWGTCTACNGTGYE